MVRCAKVKNMKLMSTMSWWGELNVERSLHTEHARASRQPEAKYNASHGADDPESLAHVVREDDRVVNHL